jgi:hypothetical protein
LPLSIDLSIVKSKCLKGKLSERVYPWVP